MKYSFKVWFMGKYLHSACKPILKQKGVSDNALLKIKTEHKAITVRAKDMSDGRLLMSYIMGIYFIAMNRGSGLTAEDNYEIIKTVVETSKLFRTGMGTAEEYLDEKKIPDRLKWAEKLRNTKAENNWTLDILPKCSEYDLGYDYHECGICKLCRDEDCFELAKYMCRLDFVIADIMGAKLVRTGTIADGDDMCDFRYSLRR